MQADKQIGLNPARLLHPHMQGHKKISVACQIGTHRVAADGQAIDAVAQAMGQAQHNIFLAGAIGAYRTRVFAAVSRVERDDDQAIGPRDGRAIAGSGPRLAGTGQYGRRGRWSRFRSGRGRYNCGFGRRRAALGNQVTQRISSG